MLSPTCSKTGRIWIYALALAISLSSIADVSAKKKHAVKTFELSPFLTETSRWELSPTELTKQSDGLFQQGLCQSELMYANRGANAMKFFDANVEECVARLAGDKLKNFYVLVQYAEDKQHLERIKDAATQMKKAIDSHCGSLKKSEGFVFSNGSKIMIGEWQSPAARVRMYVHNTTPGAYVSVLLERVDLPDRDMQNRLAINGKTALPKSPDADQCVLAVPMRYQLRGIGACWSATLTRQLAYLGSEIEPEMVSQMAGGGEGKSLDLMGKQLGFYHKTYHFFSQKEIGANSQAFLMKYNAIAKTQHQEPISFSVKDDTLAYGDSFIAMNSEIAGKIPPVDRKKYLQFRNVVLSCARQGLPVSWTVSRGSHLDNNAGSGRHRRMIVGYNLKNDSIYFSDSWGFRADRREMPFRAAFSLTLWMQVIAPAALPPSRLP